MNRPEIYKRTIEALVEGVKNGTLIHMDPCGCAVGNIVAKACNVSLRRKGNDIISNEGTRALHEWYDLIPPGRLIISKEAFTQIKATGYTLGEVIAIERAFEHSGWCDSESGKWDGDDKELKGLFAVIDVLDNIHENSTPALNSECKEQLRTANLKRYEQERTI